MEDIMGFFRYIFLIAILTGSTSIGFLLSKGYVDRLNELKELSNLINIFQNKLKFSRKPLSEIFEEVILWKQAIKFQRYF